MLALVACAGDEPGASSETSSSESSSTSETGDGDGDSAGDGDGDGEPTGDGDGDGEPTGDGDGEPSGDGDGEPSGDGDGDPSGDGDGDPDEPLEPEPPNLASEVCQSEGFGGQEVVVALLNPSTPASATLIRNDQSNLVLDTTPEGVNPQAVSLLRIYPAGDTVITTTYENAAEQTHIRASERNTGAQSWAIDLPVFNPVSFAGPDGRFVAYDSQLGFWVIEAGAILDSGPPDDRPVGPVSAEGWVPMNFDYTGETRWYSVDNQSFHEPTYFGPGSTGSWAGGELVYRAEVEGELQLVRERPGHIELRSLAAIEELLVEGTSLSIDGNDEGWLLLRISGPEPSYHLLSPADEHQVLDLSPPRGMDGPLECGPRPILDAAGRVLALWRSESFAQAFRLDHAAEDPNWAAISLPITDQSSITLRHARGPGIWTGAYFNDAPCEPPPAWTGEPPSGALDGLTLQLLRPGVGVGLLLPWAIYLDNRQSATGACVAYPQADDDAPWTIHDVDLNLAFEAPGAGRVVWLVP